MILFLDFDGVLHPEPSGDDFLFCRVPLLWQLLRAHQNIEVVFSTSWRAAYQFDELVDFCTYGGGEDLAYRFVGSTPNHPGDHLRETECLAWMQEHRPSDAWIAVDDQADGFWPGRSNLYLVNRNIGLTETDVQKIMGETIKWNLKQ